MRKQLATKAAPRSKEDDDTPVQQVVCYHAIVHREYTALTACLDVWKTKCHEFAVAQHEEDDEVPRTHCHILIGSPTLQRDRFNEILKEKLPGLEGRKDFLILVKTVKKKNKPSVAYDVDELLKYLAKGDKARLKCVENISPDRVEKAIETWVETDKSDNSTDDSYMETCIRAVDEYVSKTLEKKLYEEDEDGIELYRAGTILQACRDRAFWITYKSKSIIPPASLYKRIAGSAFMRISERCGKEIEAIRELQNLWY